MEATSRCCYLDNWDGSNRRFLLILDQPIMKVSLAKVLQGNSRDLKRLQIKPLRVLACLGTGVAACRRIRVYRGWGVDKDYFSFFFSLWSWVFVCLPAHLPLAESVDEERDHQDLQLFEGEKKAGQRQRRLHYSHTPGDYFPPFVLILCLGVYPHLNTQAALSHNTTVAMEEKKEKKTPLLL